LGTFYEGIKFVRIGFTSIDLGDTSQGPSVLHIIP